MNHDLAVFLQRLMILAVATLGGFIGWKLRADSPPRAAGKYEYVSIQDLIRRGMNDAGLTGDIAAIIDAGQEWLVVMAPPGIGPNGEPPPGRPIPQKAVVHKETFQVTKLHRDGSRPGQG